VDQEEQAQTAAILPFKWVNPLQLSKEGLWTLLQALLCRAVTCDCPLVHPVMKRDPELVALCTYLLVILPQVAVATLLSASEAVDKVLAVT
jgi:hypothetical protein